MPSGEKTGKMTKQELDRFRSIMYTKPIKELAKQFSVSESQLCRIRSGQHWRAAR